MPALLQKEATRSNGGPAAMMVVAVLAAVAGGSWLTADRPPPMVFWGGEVTPNPIVLDGADRLADAEWFGTWRKSCAGRIEAEVVDADKKKHAYVQQRIKPPPNLGDAFSQIKFAVPAILPAGRAYYHAVIRFRDCGLTSKIWPIEVGVPDLYFTVQSPVQPAK